ncbi:hypothetical protein [Halomarina rubra]|uniref:HEAT repeat protein n=1 Tax=Halomarina rubra TaxID=2071873 RepID=A0ABD6AV08_9EURY|nr:hypothetical protein [Halomarina rubra]
MSEGFNESGGLLGELQSEERQYDALCQLESASVDSDDVCRFSRELVNIASGSNALTRLKAKNLLTEWAQECPRAVGAGVVDTPRTLLRSLDEEGPEVRAPLAHALGSTGDLEALEALDDRYETEVDSVKVAIERGFEAGVESILTELSSGETADDSDVAEALLFLARYQPAFLVQRERDMFDLLEGPNGELVGDAFVRILRTSARDDLSISTLTEAVDIDEGATEERTSAAVNAFDTLLRTGVEGDTVRQAATRYLEWLESDDESTRRRGLKFSGAAAVHRPTLLSDSIDEIAELAVDGALTKQAQEVVRVYASSTSTSTEEYLQSLLRATGGEPALLWLSETLDVLKYRSQNEWLALTTGTLGQSLLTGLRRAAVEGRTVPVFWPSFRPRTTVACAVSVLFEGVADGTDTALYTKGTSTQWGGKGDVREEYERYGVEVPEPLRNGSEQKVIPLDEILPHSYVSQGEQKCMGGPPGPSTLVLVSSADELNPIEGAGPTLFNFHSRVTEEDEDVVDDITSASDELVCPMYSLYTKHQYDGNRVPQYCPPDVPSAGVLPDTRTVRDVIDESSEESEQRSEFPLEGDRDLSSLGTGREVRIEAVDAGPIEEHLNEGYEAATDLLDFGAEHAGWRSFSYLQRFERLPVLADEYDRWVLDKRRKSKRGQRSWTMDEFVTEFDEFKRGVDMLARAGTSDVHEQLEYLLRALEQRNTLYEAVCERVSDAEKERRSIAVYTPTPAWRRVLEERLVSDREVREDAFRPGRIQIVDRDSVRFISDCDELLVVGPQRSQQAGFLLHPAPDEVTVLTYSGRWRGMIDRRLRRFVDKVNRAFQATESQPIPYPDVNVYGVGSEDDSGSFEPADSEPEQARATQESFAASLDELRMDTEYAHDEDRYDDYEQQSFRIDTSEGVLYRDSGSTLLVEEKVAHSRGVDTTYKWVSPSELATGSTILVIDDGLWYQLWDEWLDDQYDDFEGGKVTDQLRVWYDTLRDIVREVERDFEAEEIDHEDSLEYIVWAVKDAGVERGENRIRHWFESVLAADDALDLARDPSLTMGPRDVRDIQLVGSAFDRPELTGERGALVDKGLRQIRGAHISQGREIRSSVAKDLARGGPEAERLLSQSSRHEVKSIEDVTDLDD